MEISWGKAATFREGGQRMENVLTTEVFQALDFLPRASFLASVLRAAHVDEPVVVEKIGNCEDATIYVLPGDLPVDASFAKPRKIQPDVIIETSTAFIVVESKRIGSSSFQRHQLARELLFACARADGRQPFVLIIASEPPPYRVLPRGKLTIAEAIKKALPDELSDGTPSEEFLGKIAAHVGWLTWQELASIVAAQFSEYRNGSRSTEQSVARLAQSILTAIEWHA